MASLEALEKIFKGNGFVDYIASKFGGKPGHRQKGSDSSDVIVSFVSEEETPVIDDIFQVAQDYYQNLGYQTKVHMGPANDSYTFMVYLGDPGEGVYTVTITTRYPLSPGVEGVGRSFLRITTKSI